MNLKQILSRFSLGVIVSLLILTACNDKNYLVGSGIHKAQYKGTIWDYLKDKPDHYDSLTRVITLAGMEDVFQHDTITFFAPSSSCIYKSVKALNQYLYNRGRDTVSDLGQIKPEVWKEMLSLYLIKGKYLLKDIPQLDTTELSAFPGQGYLSFGGKPMNIGVIYNDAGGVKYAGYRQLFYSYINNSSNGKVSMLNVPVASSDIQPYNGVVHALRYQNHVFGFKTSNFIVESVARGIDITHKK